MFRKLLVGLLLAVFIVGGISTPLLATSTVDDYIIVDGVKYLPGDEVAGLRDQYSETFYKGNDTYSTRIFLGSIHYEDVSGSFQPIDTTIVPSNKPNWDWEVTTGHWQLFINNDTTVGVRKDGNWVGTRFHGIAYFDVTTKDYTILQTTNTVTPEVSSNKITWHNILYGVDYVLHYTNDSLKEDIVIHQEARDLLSSAGHRPSDYGYIASNTYLVPIFECDWSQSLQMKLVWEGIDFEVPVEPDEIETNRAIHFESDVEDLYFPTKLVSFLPVYMATSANPINPEDPEEEWEYATCVMKKRLVKRNDRHWLLTGVPVLELNQMPEGSIIFDPTETLRPSAVGDVEGLTGTGDNYLLVDEAEADEDTTRVSIGGSTAGDAYDLYNLPASSGEGDINFIKVYLRCRYDYGTTLRAYAKIKTGGSEYEGSLNNLTESYVTYSHQWNTNLQAARAWSWADIDALQIGVRLYGAGITFDLRCTQVYVEVDYAEPIVVPTVTTQAATNIEDTTATGHGNITATGGADADIRGIVWDLSTHGDPGNVSPAVSDYANDVAETPGPYGTGAFTRSLTGLPTGDTIYCRAYAHNSQGYAYGDEVNFLTKPAAPTNVAATDGTHGDKVVITWTASVGATGYQVYRDGGGLGWLGDVATYDDTGAAPDETVYTYKVRARNATGESDDSDTDTGWRAGDPTVTTSAASLVEETTATLNGEITDVGGANATTRGFEWDLDSGAPYSNDWHEDGDFSAEAFLYALSSLTKGELYYYRAYATNSYGTTYGSEVKFLTKPDPPNTLVATSDGGEVDLTWVKPASADKTYIRGKDGSYPDDRADGYLVYNDTLELCSDAGLTGGHTYYYKAWSWCTEGGLEQFSDNYDFAFATPGLTVELWFQPITIIVSTSYDGTADAGCDADTIIDAELTQVDNYWVNALVTITETGDHLAPESETSICTAFADATNEITLTPALTAIVETDDTYTVDFGTILDRQVDSGTADSGTATTLRDALLTQADNYWNNMILEILTTTDGLAPQGESAIITDFIAADDELQFAALTAVVGAGDTYELRSDGRITWGVNPTNIDLEISPLVVPPPTIAAEEELTPPGVLPAVELPDFYDTEGPGATFPLYGFIDWTADIMGVPILLLWSLLATAVSIIAGIVIARNTNGNVAFTAIGTGFVLGVLAVIGNGIIGLWFVVVYGIISGSVTLLHSRFAM